MSTFAVLTTLSLFSGHVLAQVYWPSCTVPSFGWTYNSIEQNPCTVAAYLLSTCYGGSYNIQPLPQDYSYTGPTAGTSNTCTCSTVSYSLLSACDACQGSMWFSWYNYSTNCTTDYPASSFPNPVPDGIRVPQWALIDITIQGTWNSSQSFAVGGRNTLLSPSLSHLQLAGTPFQIFLKYLMARSSTLVHRLRHRHTLSFRLP
ncbi:hypothetical protein BGW80DRAFT_375706 [Lactifluus volemus]|nr:hypothetical protein BGW80DRAFT_375706 [Lactifluus volemus]